MRSYWECIAVVGAFAAAVAFATTATEQNNTPAAPLPSTSLTGGSSVNVSIGKDSIDTSVQLVGDVNTSQPTPAWLSDYEKAKARSIAEGKPLVVISTKEFGCPPCVRLKRQALSDPVVTSWLDEHCVVCVLVDTYPRFLRNMFSGYPIVWVRQPNGTGSVYGRGNPIKTDAVGFLTQIKWAVER